MIIWITILILAVSLLCVQGNWAVLLGLLSGDSKPPRIFLLMNRALLAEIKATPEQKLAMKRRAPLLMSKVRQARSKLGKIPEAEREQRVRDAIAEVNYLTSKKIATFLKPEQLKRFNQIERQINVALTLLQDEEIIKSLKPTAEQRERIKIIHQDFARQLLQFMEVEEREEILEKVTSLIQGTNALAVGELRDDQKKKWLELIGEPFAVKIADFDLVLLARR